MKQLLALTFITLLALGTGCAWISPSSQTTSSDGIQVHGHWTVTVTNSDGTVDAVHEFDNDLAQLGSDMLTALLAEETSISKWKIGLADKTDDLFLCDPLGILGFSEPWMSMDAQVSRHPLKLGSPLLLAVECNVRASGGVKAYLTDVRTQLSVTEKVDVHSDIGPIEKQIATFTVHTLNPMIEVLEDQILGINVFIRFN